MFIFGVLVCQHNGVRGRGEILVGGAYGYGHMDAVIPDARSMYGFCRTSGWNVVYSWDFSLVWDARHLTGDGVVSIYGTTS